MEILLNIAVFNCHLIFRLKAFVNKNYSPCPFFKKIIWAFFRRNKVNVLVAAFAAASTGTRRKIKPILRNGGGNK